MLRLTIVDFDQGPSTTMAHLASPVVMITHTFLDVAERNTVKSLKIPEPCSYDFYIKT